MINHDQNIDVSYRASPPSKNCNAKARNRWLLLAHALLNNKENLSVNEVDPVSVRRFQEFGLFSIRSSSEVDNDSVSWFDYSTRVADQDLSVRVRHVSKLITPADLMGFNNTGNVCVWPSEEVLAFYCLSNRDMFRGKSVLELGGGMTCLAGIMLAKFACPQRVLLTDGNLESVENVRAIIDANELRETTAEAAVLKWNCNTGSWAENFDVVLAADCLFFEETRKDLVMTIWDCLKGGSVALITAPARGQTHLKFLDAAKSVGFVTKLHGQNYNADVHRRHTQLKSSSPLYEEDIHYPLLISLYKPKVDLHRADYWKSQERKFCDFCKCWISNNKPSVQFHENGKKHQENVARRISEIRQKSAKAHEKKLEVDKEMEKMEQAALQAYLKDIESNPDYTSNVIKEEVARAKAEKEQRLKEAEKERRQKETLSAEAEATKSTVETPASKKWFEARSPEGYSYYWNVETGESKWELPEGAYVSLEEQLKEAEEKKKLEEKKKEEEEKKRAELELRKRKLEIEQTNERTKHLPSFGPAPRPARPDPYGGWQTVQTDEEPVDLQLPEQEYVELNVPELQSDAPKIEFKEKVITSLKDFVPDNVKQEKGVSAFKKRKFNPKGNARQRLDND